MSFYDTLIIYVFLCRIFYLCSYFYTVDNQRAPSLWSQIIKGYLEWFFSITIPPTFYFKGGPIYYVSKNYYKNEN